MIDFERFVKTFPPDDKFHADIGGEELYADIKKALCVDLPKELVEVWDNLGAGYFGDRTIYLFGDKDDTLPRDSLLAWNQASFWADIYPPIKEGGPLFLGETCFGEQIGIRKEGDQWIPILFIVDTFESFVLGNDLGYLFEGVLITRDAISDIDRLDRILGKLGPLIPGKHVAPIISPLIGGTADPNNFHFETPNVHLRTALASYQSLCR